MNEGTFAGLRVASDLIDRLKFAVRAGMTYGGLRNVNQVLGYKDTLTPDDYRVRYERGDIAASIVDAKPEATWKGTAELIEDEDPEVITDFEKAWLEFDARHSCWSKFLRGDKLAGLGEYAVLLIGAPGTLETELPATLAMDQIFFLRPFGRDEVSIPDNGWNDDLQSERYGQPEYYTIERKTVGVLRKALKDKKRVHWTRIVHIADALLDDDVNGQPRMKRSWNRLDDLDKVVGGGAEAHWMLAQPGRQWKLNPEVTFKEGEVEKAKEEIDKFKHGLERELFTRGIDSETLGGSPTQFGPNVDAILKLISGATGIPQRILTGSERGELASTQDRSNWAERITDRRQQWAAPYVVRQLVDRLINRGVLPTPKEYFVRWPETANLSLLERADMAVKWAEVNAKMGIDVTTGNEIRDHCYGIEKREELDLDEDEELPEGELPPVEDENETEDQEDDTAAPPALKAAMRRLRAVKRADKRAKKRAQRRRVRLIHPALESSEPLESVIDRPADRVSDRVDTLQQELARLASITSMSARLASRPTEPVLVNVASGQPATGWKVIRDSRGLIQDIVPKGEADHE